MAYEFNALQGPGGGPGQRPLSPTVFVALGGSGLKILARFRRRIYDRFGDADHWPIYQFLAVDSNEEDLRRGGVAGAEGIPIHGRDQINIGMDATRVQHLLREQTGSRPWIGTWLPRDVVNLGLVSFTSGAGQMRTVGRLLFLEALSKFKEKIQERVGRARSPENVQIAIERGAVLPPTPDGLPPPADIVLVGSIAGGTGAGAMLDCAYFLRAMSEEGSIKILDVRAMLLLPDVFDTEPIGDNLRPTLYANAFAFLRELEYYGGLELHPFSCRAWGPITQRQSVVEHPFQVCYMFSRDNGQPLSKASQVYDLVADALAFSMSGTPVAANMRGAWINAKQRSYLGWLGYVLKAQDEVSGGPTHADDTRNYVRFETRWSTRYSSLGVSAVTMKLPELRRLAAVRMLEQALQSEIGGEPDPKRVQELSEHCAQQVESRKELVGDYRARVEGRVGDAADAVDADAAEKAARTLLREQLNVFLGVGSPETAERNVRTVVEKLLAHCDSCATKDAAAAIKQMPAEPYRMRVAALQALEARLRNALPDIGDQPEGEESVSGIAQWRDIDQHGMADMFGLGAKALKIVRDRVRAGLREQIGSLLDRTNRVLVRRYLEGVGALIVTERDQTGRDMALLQPWLRQLQLEFTELQRAFEDERNQVLTRGIATRPEALAEEIAAARRGRQIADGAQGDAALRKLVLEGLAARVGVADAVPASFVAARRDVEPREARTLDLLVDTLAWMFRDVIPRQRDLFLSLEASGRDPRELVQAACSRGRAYWPIDRSDPAFEQTIHRYQLAGAIEHPAARAMQAAVQQQLTDAGWTWLPSAATEPGAVEGELVVVTETHGHALLSLETIKRMRTFYADCARAGDLANRHLDMSVVRDLPPLAPGDLRTAEKVIAARDAAAMALLTRAVVWDPQRGVFKYASSAYEQVEVGKDMDAIAAWLMSDSGSAHFPNFRANLLKPFELARVTHDEAKARELFQMFLDLELVLELLRAQWRPAADGRAEPDHTLLRRLGAAQVKSAIQVLSTRFPALRQGQDRLRAERAARLHENVDFVGPGSPDSDVARRLRVLALRETPDVASRAVLDEAFRLGWFQQFGYTIPDSATSLFPNVRVVP